MYKMVNTFFDPLAFENQKDLENVQAFGELDNFLISFKVKKHIVI